MKAIQNTERFTYDTIIGIVNYVKENYSKSPETEDVSQMEITWHLLLHEAISMFNNEEKRYAACSIFVWLEKQKNEVNSNIIRVLYYFLGLMNRYGIGIKENKFLAIEYFRKCIGDSGSKTGFISYRKGEDLPIEMLICSLDNFIEKAKIELGKIF